MTGSGTQLKLGPKRGRPKRRETPVKAVELCHEIAHRNLSDFPAQYQAALAFIHLENFDEAREHLEAAVSLNSNTAEAHLNLGIVYVRLDRKEEGEARFKEALRLDPGLIRGSKDAFKAEYFKVLR